MIGIPRTRQNAELAKQNRQQEQKYMDYNLRGVKPNYLQLKAQERLMEYPTATWSDFSTQNIQEDVMLQISSNYLHDVEQLKTHLATLGQEIRNLRAELQKHRVNAMKGNSRSWALISPKKENKNGSVTIVIKNDTLQIGVTKRCETEKYEECNTIYPSKGTLPPHGNIELVIPIVDHSTMKT